MSNRDLEFLYEIGSLRHMPRQWRRFGLADTQNITEHHFRVIWLALVIAAREGVKNTDKIVKMALVHDVAESRTNDVDYLSRQYVEQNEEKAIQDILAETSVQKEFMELWREYEGRETIEAKIVKDADNLDVDLEMRELGARGHDLEAIWEKHRTPLAAKNLYTKSARKIYKEIRASSPHDWHVKSSSNRVKGGDWKDKVSGHET